MSLRQAGFPPPPILEISAGAVRASVGGSIALLIALQVWYWPWTVDDAYITFRYSRNLVDGLGPVFNPGERVEGYTNFLWMIVLAGVQAIGADIVVAAKLLGAICAAATLVVSALLTHRASGDRWTLASVAVPLLLASTPSFAAWSVAGLETPLFTFLVALSLWRVSLELERPGSVPWSGLTLALAAMTRPEGVLVFLLLFGYVAVRMWRGQTEASANWLMRFGAVFLIPALPYMFWRLSYYGYLFPNTFYVKGGRGIYQWLGGLLYVSAGTRIHGGWILMLAALASAFWGPARDRAKPLVLVLVGWQAYNVYKGHDVLPLFRFFVPILPLLYGLGLTAIASACAAAGGWLAHPRVQFGLLAAYLVVSAGSNGILAYTSRDSRPQLGEYQLRATYDDDEFRTLASRLLEIAPADSTIAVIDAGYIPFITGWPTIDRWGLCDEHIAHSEPKGPLGEKFDEAYVLSRRPVFIQTKVRSTMSPQSALAWVGDVELFANPVFQRDYVRVPDATLDAFFVRRDRLASLRFDPRPAALTTP